MVPSHPVGSPVFCDARWGAAPQDEKRSERFGAVAEGWKGTAGAAGWLPAFDGAAFVLSWGDSSHPGPSIRGSALFLGRT